MIINDLLIGGAERVFVSQANALVSRGHQVSLVVLNKNQVDVDLKNELNDQVRFEQIWLLSVWNFREFRALIALLREVRPTVIYSTLDQANLVSKICKIIFPNCRIVIRESGMADRKSFKVKVFDLVFNFFVNKIIAVSPGVAESLITYQPFHKGKIEVIQNGVFIPQLTAECGNSLVKILHVGSMNNENKNQRFLIDIIALLLERYPAAQVELDLVGTGKLSQELVKYTELRGVSNHVKFLGKCLPRELDRVYRDSNIFVFASYSEGSPNAVLEAMSYGLPVVSTDVLSLRSVIVNEQNGYLTIAGGQDEFLSKLYQLVINERLRHELGHNARQTVIQGHSLGVVITKIENILCS